VSLNPNLALLGVLLTMYNKHTLLSRQVEEEIKKHFPNKVFETIVPRNVRLAEAPSYGKTIVNYDRFGKGAAAYKSLAKEVHVKVKG
jgi:chromosome partitioning protein